mgnify:FL=1|jgi:diketogulonate reductase-like aldo/keto reductase
MTDKKIKISKTNIEVYPIGQGTLFGRILDKTKIDDIVKKKISSLEYGIELGMNYLDTGEDYEDGLSEELLSKIICNKRDKVVVGSKFIPSNNSYNNVISACESSLKRLKTDYIDIYMTHWPNPNIPLEETINALSYLVKQGKIRCFGVGNFDVPQLSKVVKYDISNKFSVLQTEYDLFNRQVEDEIFDFNKINKITTLAYMSLGKDLFTDVERQLLDKLSLKYKKSIRSIVLNWIASHQDTLVLTSSMQEKHTLENYNSLSFDLLSDDVNVINNTFKRSTIKIAPNKIKVNDFDESDTAHKIYTTIEEAINNKLDIQPSAVEISEEIKKDGRLLRPVELKKNPDLNSNQPYLLVRGRMRYWGWVIAYGFEKEIECKLF